jgi:hypothetical protein
MMPFNLIAKRLNFSGTGMVTLLKGFLNMHPEH